MKTLKKAAAAGHHPDRARAAGGAVDSDVDSLSLAEGYLVKLAAGRGGDLCQIGDPATSKGRWNARCAHYYAGYGGVDEVAG